MYGISGRTSKLPSNHSRNSSEIIAEVEHKRQAGAGGRRGESFMGSPFKNLLLITVLLHMATVTMETNDFLHSNATDKGRKDFYLKRYFLWGYFLSHDHVTPVWMSHLYIEGKRPEVKMQSLEVTKRDKWEGLKRQKIERHNK